MAGICICRNKNKNTLHTRCNCDCDSFRFSCVSLFGNWISGFPYWVSRKNRADTWTKAERHSVEWADCSFFALRFTSASSKFAVLFIPPAKTHSRIIFACDFIRNEFEHFSGLIFSSLRSYCRCRSSHFFFGALFILCLFLCFRLVSVRMFKNVQIYFSAYGILVSLVPKLTLREELSKWETNTDCLFMFHAEISMHGTFTATTAKRNDIEEY